MPTTSPPPHKPTGQNTIEHTSNDRDHRVLWWSLLAMIAAVSYLGQVGRFLTPDEGIWSYIGWLWDRHAILPYRGAVENKPAGILLLHKLGFMFFDESFRFVRILGIAAIVGTAATLSRIATVLMNRTAGLIAMMTFGLAMNWNAMEGWKPGHTETFMMAFVALAFLALLQMPCRTAEGRRVPWAEAFRDQLGRGAEPLPSPAYPATDSAAGDNNNNNDNVPAATVLPGCRIAVGWLMLVGLCIGTALSFKQIAVTDTLALWLLSLVMGKRTGVSVAQLILGTVLTAVATVAAILLWAMPVLLAGVTLPEYINEAWLILINNRCGGNPDIVSRAAGFMNTWLNSRLQFLFGGVLVTLLFHKQLRAYGIPLGMICLWLGLAFLGANASGYYYRHQLRQLLPPLALLTGFGFSVLTGLLNQSTGPPDGPLTCNDSDNPDSKDFGPGNTGPDNTDAPPLCHTRKSTTISFRTLLTATLLLIFAIFPYKNLATNFFFQKHLNTSLRTPVVEWVQSHTQPEDRVFFWSADGGGFLLNSQRLSPSRYFNELFLCDPQALTEFEQDIRHRPPVAIVIDNSSKFQPPDWFTTMLEQEYQQGDLFNNRARSIWKSPGIKVRVYEEYYTNYTVYQRMADNTVFHAPDRQQ